MTVGALCSAVSLLVALLEIKLPRGSEKLPNLAWKSHNREEGLFADFAMFVSGERG